MALFLLALLLAPKVLFAKKKGATISQRLGLSIPDPGRKPVIWFHAVSVGEVKAAASLFQAFKQKHPDHFFLITTTTATGQQEAKRTLTSADAFAYLPLDFSWTMHAWVRQLKPKRFFLVESDYWLHLLSALKKNGAQIILINGKLSSLSAKRYGYFPSFAKRLFSTFDTLFVQNGDYAKRLAPFLDDPEKIKITGNLKLDLEPKKVDSKLWRSKLKIDPNQTVITVACTHAPEEKEIIDALRAHTGKFFLFLAPRHPERFNEVADLLKKMNLPFSRWSDLPENPESIILVDAMGQLPICYSLSSLAIVGGSFTPKVGGHNVLEPCFYGCYSLFGPYMQMQTEFADLAKTHLLGKQVGLENLSTELFLKRVSRSEIVRKISSFKGITQLILSQIN